MNFTRNCPDCNKVITYKRKNSLVKAERRNASCASCSKTKENNGFYGKKHSEETRKNISIGKGGTGDISKKFIEYHLHLWSAEAREKTPFCEWCYSEDNLEAHHIMPKSKFPRYAYDLDNARVMCKQCHITCHKQGGY